MSVEVIAEAEKHLEEARNLYGDHPVVGPFLESLPPDVLTSPDEAARRALGLIRVEARHTHRDATGKARIGYIACPVVDGVGCLVLVIANTSREEKVRLRNGELRNGWVGIVLAGWAWAGAARCMRFLTDDRMGRSVEVIQSILKVLKARAGSVLYWGRERIDPHKDGFRTAVSAEKSAADDDARRARVTPGFCRSYQKGAWPHANCPVGTRRPHELDVRGNPVTDPKAVIESDDSQKELLEEVLRGYANGYPKRRIAVDAARLGARRRDGHLLATQLVPLMDRKTRQSVTADLERLVVQGDVTTYEVGQFVTASAQAASSASSAAAHSTARDFVNTILDAVPHLRSGELDVIRIAPTAGLLEYMGWYPTFVCREVPQVEGPIAEQFVLEAELEPDHPYWKSPAERQKRMREKGFWRFRIKCGTPVCLGDSEWAKIEDRQQRDLDEYHRRHAPDGNARPVAGLAWTEADGRRVRLSSSGDPATHPIEIAPSNRDGRPAWVHKHTIHAREVVQQLGELLLKVAESAESHPLPVLAPPEAFHDATPLDTATQALADLEQLRSRLLARLQIHQAAIADLAEDTTLSPRRRDLRRAAIEEARDADEDTITDLEDRQIPDAHLVIDQIRAGVSSAAPPVDDVEQINANFAQITAVGLALLRCDPYGPSALTESVGWLLDDGYGFSNLRTGAGPRQLLIDVEVRLPVADGSVEWIVAGTLDLTDHKLTACRGTELTDDAARRLLKDGETLAAVAARYGWTGPQTLQRVATWLAPVVSNHYLRAAAVTAAASDKDNPVGKVLHARAAADVEELIALRSAHGNWIIDQIETAYTDPSSSWSHGTGWIRRPAEPMRAAMLAVAGAGPTGVRRGSLIAAIPGIRNDEHLKDLLHPGRSSHWQPPLRMEDGWITSHLCERPSCPGGGAAPMTGFLPVPELTVANAAVYCEYCHCPLEGDTPLPATYLKNWDINVATSSLGRADGIPTVADPIPVPDLPSSLWRSRDVAKHTGLPLHVVQRLADEGDIPSTVSATGKRTYDPRQLETRSVSNAIERARQSTSHADVASTAASNIQAGDLLGTREAAARLGVVPTHLRLLVRTGALVNMRSSTSPGYRESDLQVLLDVVRSSLADTTADLGATALLCDVAQEFGLTTSVVKRMLKEGILCGVTLGTTTLVLRKSINDLDERQREALDPDRRLSMADVAERAGISEATVNHHCTTETLSSVQFYPRGMRFFLESEVVAWLSSREET